jgi:hypothetical protein
MDIKTAHSIMHPFILTPQTTAEILLKLKIEQMELIADKNNVFLRFTPIECHEDGVAAEFEVFYNTEESFSDYFTTSMVELIGNNPIKVDDWLYTPENFDSWLKANDPRREQ